MNDEKLFNSNESSCKPSMVTAYFLAKDVVINAGFGEEIEWQASRDFNEITETEFLREHAWVVLSTGMRETIVRRVFGPISDAFYNWQSSYIITDNACQCRLNSLQHFNHPGKIDAIIEASRVVSSIGFSAFKDDICHDPISILQQLPFIGPVTSYHLVKNIGLPFAKADRHLVRLATSVGYSDVQQFCTDICYQSGDSVPVVDIVLWRFATIAREYESFFCKTTTENTDNHVAQFAYQGG